MLSQELITLTEGIAIAELFLKENITRIVLEEKKKMSQPNRYGQYKCPYGKFDGISPAMNTKESKATVTGRYCKNQCKRYKKNKCKLFNKEK